MNANYLPHWTNEYSDFRSQYDACSIMIKQDSAYTLLPVRLDEDVCPYLSGRWYFSFTVNKLYGEGGFWRHKNYIQHTKYAFAKKLYIEAAIQLMMEYPNLEDITFGDRLENGIYPIKWKYSPEVLKNRLYSIMERKLSDGFYIDEFIRVEFEETENGREYKFYGTLDMEKNELEDLLYTHSEDYIRELYLKKGIRYTLEECKEYYREFEEDILMLGNQPRVYGDSYKKNERLFEAAREGNFELMTELAQMGGDLNAMDEEGNTPFLWFAGAMIEGDKNGVFPTLETEQLDSLIELGANPAMYGVGINATGALALASKCGNLEAVRYLLSKGVNPLYYPVKDEDDMSNYTAAGEAEAEYFSETAYRGNNVSSIYNDYLEISRLLRCSALSH